MDKLDRLYKLKRYLERCPQEDLEQNVLRLITIALTIIFLYQQDVFENSVNAYITITYTSAVIIASISIILFLSLIIFPEFYIARRIIGMAFDLSFCTYAMIGAEEQGAPLFFVYYWICVGNGVRWGVGYLYCATVLGLIGFCLVFVLTEYWTKQQNLAVGIIFGLIIIPLFVAQLLKRLNRAIVSERSANEAKSLLIANVSHEMRTPLNGIKGYVDLIQKEKLSDKVESYLEPIVLSANNLMSEINKVLDFSKIEAGEMTTTFGPVNLRNTIESEVEVLKLHAKRKGLELVVMFSQDIPVIVNSDEVAIRRIVRNLVENSLKFTTSGKVALDVDATLQGGQKCVIWIVVTDTGIGISPEVTDQIFYPFRQLEGGADRKYAGTGLGLSITRGLVTQMGGKISVKSEIGESTQFTVELPMTALDISEMVIPNLGAGEIGINAEESRVLVVDDNEINCSLLKAMLETLEFRADTAVSGKSALELCSQNLYRMIFVDIHMPGMDGIETMNKLKEISASELAPLVAVTADLIGLRNGDFGAAEFDDVLTKPIDKSSLKELVARFFPEFAYERNTINQTSELNRFQADILDRARGLEFASGSEELWRSSVNQFLEKYPGQANAMRAALNVHDLKVVWDTAHHIKGSAQCVGANSVCECVECLGDFAKQGSVSDCESQLVKLENEFFNVRSLFESM